MAVTALVEMKAKPGRRDERLSLVERIIKDRGPNVSGFLRATLYKAVDDPDIVVEIADWESAEARQAVREQAEAAGAFAPMLGLLADRPRDMLVERQP